MMGFNHKDTKTQRAERDFLLCALCVFVSLILLRSGRNKLALIKLVWDKFFHTPGYLFRIAVLLMNVPDLHSLVFTGCGYTRAVGAESCRYYPAFMIVYCGEQVAVCSVPELCSVVFACSDNERAVGAELCRADSCFMAFEQSE